MTDDIPFDALPTSRLQESGAAQSAPRQLCAAESEKTLLGSLLSSDSAWDVVSSTKLKSTDFYFFEHQLVFETIASLHLRRRAVDVVTVFEELKSQGKDEEVGGLQYINSLMLLSTINSALSRHVEIILEYATLRRLNDAAKRVQESIFSREGKTIEQIVDLAEESVFKIAEERSPSNDGFVTAEDAFMSAVGAMVDREQAIRAGKDSLPGVSTGMRDLDNVTSGLQGGDLVVIAGRPSMGKTALALNIAANVARRDKQNHVAIFSLEMDKGSVMLRMLSSALDIEFQKLRSAKMSDDEWARIASPEADAIRLMPMHIMDTSMMSIAAMRAEARKLKRTKGKLSAIVVDYLQLMSGSDVATSENRSTELGIISRGLKMMAKEMECPVIALSQLNRGVESRTNKRPMMSDLRESGAIEQDADVIMMLYRDEYYNPDSPDRGLAEVNIGKQRNGPVGTVKLAFDARYTRFSDAPEGVNQVGGY